MKTYLRPLFLLIIVTVFLSSCRTAYYYPSQQNVPLFTEKNETNIVASGTVSFGNEPIVAGELNAAHAISEEIFLVGNGSYFTNNDETGFLADAGAGYFKPLTQKPNSNWIFEVQGAAGFGKPDLNFSLEFYRFYVQPAIGLRSRFVDFAISTRITSLYFKNTNPNRPPFLVDIERNERIIMEYGTHVLAEPAFTLRFGYKNFMFHQQMSFAIPFTDKPLVHNPVSFSGGLSLRLPFKKAELP